MTPDFPVVDDAVLAFMDKLNGIFHRDDVVFPGPVGLVDDGGQGGRLP